MNSIATIEDLLEAAAGMSQHPRIQLDKEDITIMHSIARQVFKGTALTDRQFALMQEKLSKYKDQFINFECDFDYAVEQLRQPLREIDRSKYIKICKGNDEIPLKGFEHKIKWIKVRFPFSKTLITDISELVFSLKDVCEYHHSKGSHEHYFSLTELSAYEIVTKFYEKNFEIEEDLVEIKDEVSKILEQHETTVPGIYNGMIKNVNSKALESIKQELGDIEGVRHIKVIDRHRRYGIAYIDSMPNVTSLTDEIATRNDVDFLCKPSQYKTTSMLEAIYNLDRFPLIVLLDESNAENELYECYNFFRHIIPHGEQSVLFRQTNATTSGSSFNQYIKDNNLNNWVDNNTKVVYISNNKIPKILINNEWSPNAAIVYGSLNRQNDAYIKNKCDLIVFRDEYASPMRKYSRLYG
jgi:hypothetical protein